MAVSSRAFVVILLEFSLIISLCNARRFEPFNLTKPTYLRAGKDYEILRIPDGLPLGDQGSQDTMLIWRNGIVTFGASSALANLSTPTKNYSEVNTEYIVAPLWFQNISTTLVNSNVSWEVEEIIEGDEGGSGEDNSYLLEFAEIAVDEYTLNNFGKPTDFTPNWAIIINWNVSLSPDRLERQAICRAYYDCRCERYRGGDFFYYYYYEYYNNDTYHYENSSGSGPCPTEECYGENGWSYSDIYYLSLLCSPNQEYLYLYYDVVITFQLVLATDGINTHAISVYNCNFDLFFAFSVLEFVYNDSSIGHRLGNQYDDYTCLEGEITSLFRCSFVQCTNVLYLYDYFYETSVQVVLNNLTDGFDEFQNIAELEEGIDYIPFQFLNLEYTYADNSSNSTIGPGIITLARYLDGSSDAIIHPGIGIGTTTQTKIYVGTNGIISFGRPFYFWYPQRFPTRYPWIREAYVAAPFWMDIDIRSRGDVIYSVLSPEEAPIIYNNVSTFLSYQLNTTFKAEWILLAGWLRVPVYPHYYVKKYSQYYSGSYRDRVLSDFNTFEAIIASSGADTYAIFTYNCDLLTNPGLYRGAVVGYNLGGFEYLNNPFSESLAANRIACLNWPSSNWFNLIYKLNSGEDAILQARKTCRELVAADDDLITEDKILEYQQQVSPCPCTIRNAWRDRNYRWDSNNYYCYYRRLANAVTGQFDQYCCYDINPGTWGALVKSGYRVSGMVELHEDPSGRYVSQNDLDMKRYCCGLADLCDLYLKRRPPNDCSGYEPPVWTWAWGDPHLTTLDGHSYTFNGYGEYVMLRYNDSIQFQGRMRPTPGTQATQFSSFVIGTTSAKVEVNCDDPEQFCTTWYNELNISAQLTAVNDSYYSSADVIEVSRESETTVTVVLGAGMALAVTYNTSAKIPSFQLTLNPSLSGDLMEGLLGNRDSDPSNDLISQNGDQLGINTASEQEIFDFGNTWRIMDANNSLFTYADIEGPNDYYDSTWTPVFYSDLLAQAEPDVLQACTPEGATEPLQQCVFDAVATGDIGVGMATMDTLNENTIAMTESTNLPPVITSSVANDTLYLSFISTISITLSVTDDNDDSVTLSLLDPPPGASLVLVSTGEYAFTWTLYALEEDEELFTLMFSAVDSQEAVTTYTPRVQVCACQNNGNCTLEGATVIDDIIIMNCICSPAWEGRYCQLDVDGCLESACFEGVECMDVPAPEVGATCDGPCPVGYIADGAKCADLDECVSDPCEQICTNTEGSYECSCYRGYLTDPSNYSQCIDYDECAYYVDDCEQLCTNTDGSYQCSCREGFVSTGSFCTPEESCSPTYTECGTALCALVNGTEECYCEQGFQLDYNGTGCSEIDECEFVTCAHSCIDLPGTFACSCFDGYQIASDFVSCIDVDECLEASLRGNILCPDGEVCANAEGGYDCVCAPGLYSVTMIESDGYKTTACASLVVDDDRAQQSITVTFISIDERELLVGGVLDTLSSLIVNAVMGHCGSDDIICVVESEVDDKEEAEEKRHSHLAVYDPSEDLLQPVYDILNVESVDTSGVSISFYVDVLNKGVLNGSDTLEAVQANQDLFQDEFGGVVSFVLTYPPYIPTGSPIPPVTQPDDEELDIAVIAGVTAAVAVVAIFLATSLALVLYLCTERLRKNKSASKDRKALLTEGVSWPDGKGGGASEMTEVPPQGPKMTEDVGHTVCINEDAT